MKLKVASLLLLTLFLGSCLNAEINKTENLSNVSVQNKNKEGIESQVVKSRLEATLSILSGKSAMPDGIKIPERGSTEGRDLTRKFISQKLQEFGYTVERHKYRTGGENLFVKLMAKEPTTEYILVGAHMDSVRNAGADDNGTGSTAVLEAANLLRNLNGRKINIIFAWFDEEELGLIGSKAMAKDFKQKGLNITSVHTSDMIGYDSDKDKKIEIEQPDGDLWDYYKMVNETHNLKLPLSRTSSGDTDHVAFRNAGFKSVGLSEEWVGGDTTPFYHQKTDSYESISFDFLEASTKLMIATVGDLSLKIPSPANIQIQPHSMFPARERHFHKF